MQITQMKSTTQEWEALVGEEIRASRIAMDLDQASLAANANVSIGALSNLERGKGSSVRTLVAVVRALGRTDWLQALAPSVTVSPLRMLRGNTRSAAARVRSRKTVTPQHHESE
jgi:transcriptional regulator with XRE-family HTH domain